MEVGLILIIIFIQLLIFGKAIASTRRFRTSLPDVSNIYIRTNKILLDENDTNSPLVEYHTLSTSFHSDTYNRIQESINQYLVSNKGATADMGLLKNIVERNIHKLENEINSLTPIPLYLGLMGTMGGIIIGLFQIPSVESTDFTDGVGIDVLISGVKFAMISSIIGVLFTTTLSGWLIRTAKFKVEEKVNDLLTFLETRLLPILKEDVSVNLHNLYQNLAQFNHHFTRGVNRLHDVMENNHNAITSQVELIKELKRIDISRFSQANADIFKEMQLLMPQFSLLNDYIRGINDTMTKSNSLTIRLDMILDKTNKVTDIANYLQSSTDKSIALNQIVERHFDEISNRNQLLILATNNMEDKVKLSIDHFKSYVESEIEALKEFTRKEEDLMIKVFETNRNALSNLNELTFIKQELIKLNGKPVYNYEDKFKTIHDDLNKIIVLRSSKGYSSFKSFLIKYHLIKEK